MPIGSKFSKPSAPAPIARAIKKSRYAGIKTRAERPPMPHAGTYRARFDGAEEVTSPRGNGNVTYKASATITGIAVLENGEMVEVGENKNHKIGDSVQLIFLVSIAAGLGRTKALVMAAAGFEAEDEYDRFDPDGDFIDSTTGVANDMSDLTIVGRLFDMSVARGADVVDKAGKLTGDYYREYTFGVVADEEQESVPSVIAQQGGRA